MTVTLIPLIRKQIWFCRKAAQQILQHYLFVPRMSIINIVQEMNYNATKILRRCFQIICIYQIFRFCCKTCASSTIWKERDSNLYSENSDCMNAVLAGACYAVLNAPRKTNRHYPYADRSVKTRLSCRRGINFGTWNEIRDAVLQTVC